ncbi:MAG: alpha/beta fold hydrolase [Rubrivivax sp.]|nr:alpha/beta fold hydrolase [Rubrivivax sp.]
MTAWLIRLFGALILLSAIVLAMSRAPERPVDSLVARWAPPPSDFIELKGQLVHLRDEGPRDDPLPVVLIHGTSASLHTWEGWVRALKGQRRVISFDLPGFGLTGPATGAYAAAGYHGDAYARFVLDLLDQLQVPQAVIGGNSLGGEVAWRTAVMAPQRVHSLVLVDAAGPSFKPDAVPMGWIVARTPVLGRVTEWILPRSLVAQGLASVYGDPSKVTPDLVDRYFELTLREGNRRALRERLQAMVIGEHAERIAAIRQPTLLVWGGRDRIFDLGVARAFEQAIPGSRLVVFDALGHVPQEEDPAASVVPVREFLGLR